MHDYINLISYAGRNNEQSFSFFKMKQLLIYILVLMCCCIFALPAYADGLPPDIQSILDEPEINVAEFQQMTLIDLWNYFMCKFKRQLVMPLTLAARLSASILLCGALLVFLEDTEWKRIFEKLCFWAICSICIPHVMEFSDKIVIQVNEWKNYIISFIPAFTSVMISCGQAGQASVYGGMFLAMASFSAQLISEIIVPVVRIYIVVAVAVGLCDTEGMQDMSALFYRLSKWMLGFLSVAFSTILALQSCFAQAADSLAMRTGQFILSSSIPIVGGIASDAMTSVICGMKILKSSLGFAAVMVLAFAFVPISIQGAGIYLSCFIGSSLAKAFGVKKAGTVLENMERATGLCLSFLVFFFLLIVISTALMILAGGS